MFNNNDETFKLFQRINEENNEKTNKIISENNLSSSRETLSIAEGTQETIKNNINEGLNLLIEDTKQRETELKKNISTSSESLKNFYPYHVKNEIYKNVLDEVLEMLSEEDRQKYINKMIEIYKNKLGDELFHIDIYEKRKKTSNY